MLNIFHPALKKPHGTLIGHCPDWGYSHEVVVQAHYLLLLAVGLTGGDCLIDSQQFTTLNCRMFD